MSEPVNLPLIRTLPKFDEKSRLQCVIHKAIFVLLKEKVKYEQIVNLPKDEMLLTENLSYKPNDDYIVRGLEILAQVELIYC